MHDELCEQKQIRGTYKNLSDKNDLSITTFTDAKQLIGASKPTPQQVNKQHLFASSWRRRYRLFQPRFAATQSKKRVFRVSFVLRVLLLCQNTLSVLAILIFQHQLLARTASSLFSRRFSQSAMAGSFTLDDPDDTYIYVGLSMHCMHTFVLNRWIDFSTCCLEQTVSEQITIYFWAK